ncbi:MAG: dihydrolipoyl dehydrogenase family protein [Phycisphaerales bacterium]
MVVGEFTQETDLLIIGGGPAGYAAAFRARALGIDCAILDNRDELGGICLHSGCIPSKSLTHAAGLLRGSADAHHMGIGSAETPATCALEQTQKWMHDTIAALAKGLASRAKSLGVARLKGLATFEDGRTVAITGGSVPRVRFRRCIIATGSRPRLWNDVAFDDSQIWSPDHAVTLPAIPASMLIIGCDYMAVEIASVYAALGARVSLLTEASTLLEDECRGDADLIKPVMRRLKKHLHEIVFDAKIELVQKDDKGITVAVTQKNSRETITADVCVACMGRSATVESLNLAATKVTRDDAGFIIVDQTMHTNDPRIFAIGDVTGPPFLANVALLQGRIAAEVISGDTSAAFDVLAVPTVIHADPETAVCGHTEVSARAAGYEDVATSTLPLGASGRAVLMGRNDGIVKLIFDRATSVILGAAIVAPGAGEMIATAALAIEMGATLEELAATLHPHPSICELLCDAARNAIGA